MTHLGTADTDPEFARLQIERFREATAPLAHLTPTLRTARRPAAARGTLRRRPLRDRLYGLSPFGTTPLRRARAIPRGRARSRWRSCSARSVRRVRAPVVRRRENVDRDRPRRLRGRLPQRPAGTEGAVAGERRRVVGAISMDAFAVELDRELPRGTPVTIVGAPAPGGAREEGRTSRTSSRWASTRPRRARAAWSSTHERPRRTPCGVAARAGSGASGAARRVVCSSTASDEAALESVREPGVRVRDRGACS